MLRLFGIKGQDGGADLLCVGLVRHHVEDVSDLFLREDGRQMEKELVASFADGLVGDATTTATRQAAVAVVEWLLNWRRGQKAMMLGGGQTGCASGPLMLLLLLWLDRKRRRRRFNGPFAAAVKRVMAPVLGASHCAVEVELGV